MQGTTLSPQQAVITSEVIRRNGLEQQCAVEYRNIRTSPYPPQTFNKITDINVLEPAASSQIPKYFDCMHRILAAGGLLLLQRMTLSPEAALHRSSVHLQGMLFSPDVAPLSFELQAAEAAGLEVLSVENLCKDYRRTLRLWIEQLQYDPRKGITSEQYRSYRTWLLYLVETATTLEAGDVQFHQILLRRPPKARDRRACSRLSEKTMPPNAHSSATLPFPVLMDSSSQQPLRQSL